MSLRKQARSVQPQHPMAPAARGGCSVGSVMAPANASSVGRSAARALKARQESGRCAEPNKPIQPWRGEMPETAVSDTLYSPVKGPERGKKHGLCPGQTQATTDALHAKEGATVARAGKSRGASAVPFCHSPQRSPGGGIGGAASCFEDRPGVQNERDGRGAGGSHPAGRGPSRRPPRGGTPPGRAGACSDGHQSTCPPPAQERAPALPSPTLCESHTPQGMAAPIAALADWQCANLGASLWPVDAHRPLGGGTGQI